MNILIMLLMVAVTLTAAGYAQYRLQYHMVNIIRCWMARLVLAAVGLAGGYVAAGYVPEGGLITVLAFLGGFGVMHVPAAFILLLKRHGAGGRR